MPKNGSMGKLLGDVPARRVIWALLAGLVATLLFVGRGYNDRLCKVEGHIEKQNGALHDIQLEQRTQGTDLKWIREHLENGKDD